MKRRFRLGPATTFALAAGIAIAYVKWPDYARQAEAKRGLDATRAEIARRGPAKLAPQSLESLWNSREKLGLSAAQVKTISALRGEESRSTAALKRETDAAATQFSRWMSAHQSGATMDEIQSQAALYSAKSGELSAARRAFFARAVAVLTASQRARISL